MADLKTLLKEARKLIDEKNYKEAQECCKDILRKDKQNYLGLVLLGKSLQESDQAPLAFQKAIATKPELPLAWQGLANYYEKKEDSQSKKKLLRVYDEMLKLQLDEEKSLEIINKVGELGCSLKDEKSIAILLSCIDNKPNVKIYETAKTHLLQLLKLDVAYNEEDTSKLINNLKEMISKEYNDSICILLGKVILQKNNQVDALDEVLQLNFFKSSVTFREWLCKYLCKRFIQQESFCEFEIEKYQDEIIQGIENSKYPGLLNSMIQYNKGLYLEAYKQCVPLVNYQEADETEATFIIKCAFQLQKWSVVQKLATNFLIKVKDNNFALILKKFLFLSLAHQHKWAQAIQVAKDIPIEMFTINDQATLAKCYIEVNEYADHIMKNLQSTELFSQLQALYLIKQEKYREAITLLESLGENSQNFFYIGKAYWELQQYDKSCINLLKAAKLDAEHAGTFLYLGMFYYHCKTDFSKAKKCYEKAYSLNNTDHNIMKNLSDVYIKLNLKEDNFKLLHNANQHVLVDQPWINFRLGLHYINNREWENAILQFRNVIKSNHNDVTAFECLADAYFSRGSFTSALKAYNRVIMMNSNKTLHCLTRIGHIHCVLTQYDEAISTFEKILKVEPFFMLALKGIAETWMKIATKKFNAKLYGSARDTAQNAINYIVKALSKERKFECFWNLLGYALIFLTKLPDEYSFVWLKIDDNMDMIKKEKLDIYPQALACYSMIAKQKQQITSYELASTYFDYYIASKDMVHCNLAFQLTIACIKLKPSAWRNWNLLGKICIFMKKYALAQHCFIKALLVTRKWSVAEVWCNLGALYIKMNLHKLANYCFWRGQSTLPSYSHSWIGQGLIAEVIREEEAMDLFRHASRLGYHPESALGYADWVCRTIKHDYKNSSELKYVIDNLDAITYAMDLVIWFSTFEPNNAYSCNILGILQERSGLLCSALQSYQRALQYAEDDKQNFILLNIGRMFLRLGKYDGAIKIYKAITEASLNSACGLAFGLLKKGLYEEAYSAYDTALHWLSNYDDEKADLLVAMAGIVYMYKGVDDAKTLLFHSIQISQKKPTANSLFAICSLGIIHSDQGLSKLALSELRKYERDSKYGYDIGFLKSYLVVDNDLNQAIKILSDSLHDHPDNHLLWFCMAQYCLNVTNTKAKIASCSAQRAITSAFNCENYNTTLSAKMLATASIAEHITGNRVKGMLLAKGGLHMYPCQSDIWAVLLFSVLTDKMWIKKSNWILNRATHMRKNLDTNRVLSRWVNLLEKKMNTQLSS